MKDRNTSIGDDIRNLRKRVGLSQEDLAIGLGVSFASINRWERGHVSPSIDHLKAIRKFRCDVHKLKDVNSALNTGNQGASGRSNQDLRERLVKLRDRLNLSQTELANRLGASYASVNRWENGHVFPSRKFQNAIRHLERYAEALQKQPRGFPRLSNRSKQK